MSSLADKTCVPCKGGTPPLPADTAQRLKGDLDPAWDLVGGHHLARTVRFPDFATALAFVNAIAAIAEAEGHHPDLTLGWGKVGIEIYTHAIDGLTESDFILAAKFDRAAR